MPRLKSRFQGHRGGGAERVAHLPRPPRIALADRPRMVAHPHPLSLHGPLSLPGQGERAEGLAGHLAPASTGLGDTMGDGGVIAGLSPAGRFPGPHLADEVPVAGVHGDPLDSMPD